MNETDHSADPQSAAPTAPTNSQRTDQALATRSYVGGKIERSELDLRIWISFAIGLVALHVVEFVAYSMPWLERRLSGDRVVVLRGMDATTGISSGLLALCSLVLLGVSVTAVFSSFGSSSGGTFALRLVVGLAVARVVLYLVASNAAVRSRGFDYGVRRGIVFAVLTACLTACVAWSSIRRAQATALS